MSGPNRRSNQPRVDQKKMTLGDRLKKLYPLFVTGEKLKEVNKASAKRK